MVTVLGVLGLVLLQEPVRIQEDERAKERRRGADLHYRLGVEALHTERFEEAEQELRQAVRLDPNSFRAYYSLGKTFLALKEYDASVRAYLSCRQAWERSVADNVQQTFDQARRDDQSPLRGLDRGAIDPPAEFALALGSAYLRAGSIDDAERAYSEALKLRPKYGEAHNNLAVICIKRGDYDGAYSHVKAAQKAGFQVHPQLLSDIQAARRNTRR
jgi:Flp pilus assembly protein TadD